MLRALGIALSGLAFGGLVAYGVLTASVDPVSPPATVSLAPLQATTSPAAPGREVKAFEAPDKSNAASDSLSAQLEALARLHGRSPAAAWQYLAPLRSAVRSELARELARLWTQTDLPSALSHAETIAEPALRIEWLANVFTQWAYRDPLALLAYAAELDSERLPAAAAALEITAFADSRGVLALSERLPTREQRQVRAAAIGAIATTDPSAALALAAERASHANERSALERTVARAYASADFDSALTWARSLSPPSSAILSEVAAVLAERDFDQAASLLLAEASTGHSIEAGTALRAVLGRAGNERIVVLADALAGLGTLTAKASVVDLVSAWSYYDAGAALAWVVERGDSSMLSTAAVYAGDVGAAFALIERVPEAQRAAFVSAAAMGHAFEDLPQALAALEGLRASPHYKDAVGAVVNQATTRNPAFAAQLLEAADADLVAGHAPAAAGAWARRAPRDALRWALALGDADVRAVAVGRAVAEWAARDPRAAGDWAAALPAGPLRDHAIATTIVNAEANGLAFAWQLLDRLSPDARDRALGAAASLPRLLRVRHTLIANAVPGVVAESDPYVGILPWDPP